MSAETISKTKPTSAPAKKKAPAEKPILPLLTPKLRQQVRYIIHDRDKGRAISAFKKIMHQSKFVTPKKSFAGLEMNLQLQQGPFATIEEEFEEFLPIQKPKYLINRYSPTIKSFSASEKGFGRKINGKESAMDNQYRYIVKELETEGKSINSEKFSNFTSKSNNASQPIASSESKKSVEKDFLMFKSTSEKLLRSKKPVIVENLYRSKSLLIQATDSNKSRENFVGICKKLIHALRFMKIMSEKLQVPPQIGWEYQNFSNNEFKSTSFSSIETSLDKFSESHTKEFDGKLSNKIRMLFRKEIKAHHEIELLLQWTSTMNVFRNFTKAAHLELINAGKYESWDSNRIICKEGHIPKKYYIVLDGDVVLSSVDKVRVEIEMNARKAESFKISKFHKNRLYKEYQEKFKTEIGSRSSGESFGEEVLLAPDTPRPFTAITRVKTEFLVIDILDFKRIEQELMPKGLERKFKIFSENNTLFNSISFKNTSYSSICQLRTYQPQDVIISEGHNSNFLYFISEGSCSILKKLLVIREVTPNGKTITHMLPLQYQYIAIIEEPDVVKNVFSKKQVVLSHPRSFHELQSVNVDIGSIGVGTTFGENGNFVKSIDEKLNNSFVEPLKLPYLPSSVSIVADSVVQIIGIPKENVSELASRRTLHILFEEQKARCCIEDIIKCYIQECRYTKIHSLKAKEERAREHLLTYESERRIHL